MVIIIITNTIIIIIIVIIIITCMWGMRSKQVASHFIDVEMGETGIRFCSSSIEKMP